MISIQGVLVPVDFSKESILAAKFAASLAQEYKAKLYVLYVREPIPGCVQAEIANFDAFEQRLTEQEMENLSNVIPGKIKELISVEELFVVGSPVQDVIVERAEQLDVDVIVIAADGRTGLADVVLGSVAEHVIGHAPCPVFVIRNFKDRYVYGWEYASHIHTQS